MSLQITTAGRLSESHRDCYGSPASTGLNGLGYSVACSAKVFRFFDNSGLEVDIPIDRKPLLVRFAPGHWGASRSDKILASPVSLAWTCFELLDMGKIVVMWKVVAMWKVPVMNDESEEHSIQVHETEQEILISLSFVSCYLTTICCVEPLIYIGTLFSLKRTSYLSSSVFINGPQISGLMGAKIPFSLRVPSRTCWTATAQGTPTSLAIAE
jgi:hypothetical protein